MKTFLTLMIMLISMTSFSQALSVNKTDPFDGTQTKATEWYVAGVGASTMKMRFACVGNLYVIYVKSSENLGCSGVSTNALILKFTDGTMITLEDSSQIDCGELAVSYFIFDPIHLQGKDMDMFRFQQSTMYDDANWSCQYSLFEFLTVIQ